MRFCANEVKEFGHLSSFTHFHIIPNPHDLISSSLNTKYDDYKNM